MVNSSVTVNVERNAALSAHFPFEKMNGIYDLCRQLVATNRLDVLLDTIVRLSVEIVHVRDSQILTLEPDGSFACQAAYSLDSRIAELLRKQRFDARVQSLYKTVVIHEMPRIIGQGTTVPMELRLGLQLGFTDTLYLIPLRVNQEAVGILALGEENRVLPDEVLKEKIRLASLIADQAAGAIYRARLSHRLEKSGSQTVMALSKVMESRDAYVADHSRKVTTVAVQLAGYLGCSPDEVQSIRWAGMLHDIGKVGISDTILNKSSRLNKEEWEVVRQHPESGAEIVRMSSDLDYVASLILAHHERYDGSGYPFGLQREMIPFGARILAVADAYSAMTDDRPYRARSTLKEAILELERCSGSQFDPRVVEAFIQLYA
jgi:putative nucleotidyltransferase with HDIG domain